jgi:phosphoribosyl 1,2-cyclic phosphate phosphodiesterase
MIACPCEVCHSEDSRDRRLRTSVLVRVFGVEGFGGEAASSGVGDACGDGEALNFVIDAGPDFRAQMLAAAVTRLDAILLTHEHKDHTGGLDDVRAYNYFGQVPIDIWATERVQAAVRRDYGYAFEEHPYPGAPEIALHGIPSGGEDGGLLGGGASGGGVLGGGEAFGSVESGGADDSFEVKGVRVTPIHGRHMNLPVTGFRIGGVAYLTDFNHIDDAEVEKLRGVDTLVVNALGHKKHISHFSLPESIELSRRVGARVTYLTHIAHRMGLYAEIEPTLPEGIHLAYDGLTITI